MMALSAQLRLRQAHSLALTPQLIQSIRLLQMTTPELEHFINAELVNNPLLEKLETSPETEGETEGFSSGDAADEPEKSGPDPDKDELVPDLGRMAEIFDSGLENVYPDDPVRGENMDSMSSAALSAFSDWQFHTESADTALLVSAMPGMRDHLHEQIIFAFREAAARVIAADLAEQIDESGYFTGDLTETAQRLHAGVADVERVFHRLQDFEPAGIFARNLAECLGLQLRRRGRLDPAMEILLKNLPALARRDFVTLARLCRVEWQDVMEMLEEIRQLDPKPATIWSTAVAGAVVPDAFVRENRDGTFHVELNSAVLPSLVVNRAYSPDICADVRERAFFSACQQHANWLMRALDQRAKTLLKVSSEIVRHQQAFFHKGVVALRPLNRAMIARTVGMHESTVSRVTSHKYLATPRGVFELRSFFSNGIGVKEDFKPASTDAVRFRIRTMIEAESAEAVLSDDAIVEKLRAEGIELARRTVAKYRESMNIASSFIRKRTKKYKK